MPVKKSAILFILLAFSSVSLLVFSPAITQVEPVTKCKPGHSCRQMNEPGTFSPLHMISQIMLRSAA